MLRKVSKTLASFISFLRFAFEAKQQNDVKCKAFRSQHLIRHLIYFWKEKCRNLQFICSPGDFCLFSRTKRQNSISKGMALKSEREVSGQISVICPQKKVNKSAKNKYENRPFVGVCSSKWYFSLQSMDSCSQNHLYVRFSFQSISLICLFVCLLCKLKFQIVRRNCRNDREATDTPAF